MIGVYSDCVHARVEITLGWWDRWRLLFGAKMLVKTHIETENLPGHTRPTESDVFIYFKDTPRSFRRADQVTKQITRTPSVDRSTP